VRSFDQQACACAEYLHKCSKVGVQRRLAYDEWRNAEGQKRYGYSVIGQLEFLDPPPLSDGASP
jgi:single-stranded DNA-binding protein